ncbi:MAG: hypothetical protein ACM30G_11590 [Micromonosporaceae bacterium]
MTIVLVVACLIAISVTVVRTMPRHPPVEPLTLNDLAFLVPDARQTELVAAIVRARIANAKATPNPAATATPAACLAPRPPHRWNSTQRDNATTIVQVGLALGISERGLVVALATAMQESQLYNLGYLGARNDHDSLGLFQQRPSMGWGSKAQVTDPVYSATAFYLALQRVSGWESMAVTAAAQRVQRSAFPNAYAKWETDATSLSKQILCSESAGRPASSA